jgi:hypothetical protein
MGAVNDSFSFERDTSPGARSAFSSPPKRTLFPEGVEFCRIVTTANKRTGEKGNEIFGSPWWFSRETFRKIVSRADPKGLGISEVARIDLAVAKEFNPKMDWFCVIYLTRPAYGWTGKAARQLAREGANIYWGGGADQVFLPNLASPGAENSSDWARLRFFGMLPDFF